MAKTRTRSSVRLPLMVTWLEIESSSVVAAYLWVVRAEKRLSERESAMGGSDALRRDAMKERQGEAQRVGNDANGRDERGRSAKGSGERGKYAKERGAKETPCLLRVGRGAAGAAYSALERHGPLV